LLVYNKIDRLTPEERAGLATVPHAITLSAPDAQTTRPLLAAMEEALWREGRMERGTLQE
jgi:50S ribosomal subunit-associated GTPase HflX